MLSNWMILQFKAIGAWGSSPSQSKSNSDGWVRKIDTHNHSRSTVAPGQVTLCTRRQEIAITSAILWNLEI
jgi:hypothetical protein